MGDKTGIEWTDHTFNPWVGCTKVSPACDHCYAEGWAKRTGQANLWQGERRRTSASNWQQPMKWNARAAAEGRRYRVFCASLADVFDNQAPEDWRADLWDLIGRTAHLDWLLLTKRPQNIAKMLPVTDSRLPGYRPWNRRWPEGWPNVWLGTTAENQDEADRRIPLLLATPAAVHFISAEPMLEHIVLDTWLHPLTHEHDGIGTPLLDWIIVGGESGPGARPCWTPNVRSIVRQCHRAGVPVFVKQMGSNVQDRNDAGFDGCDRVAWPDVDPDDIKEHVDGYQTDYQGAPVRIRLRDRKGGDMDEWPEDLRVRQLPEGKR